MFWLYQQVIAHITSQTHWKKGHTFAALVASLASALVASLASEGRRGAAVATDSWLAADDDGLTGWAAEEGSSFVEANPDSAPFLLSLCAAAAASTLLLFSAAYRHPTCTKMALGGSLDYG